MACKLAEGSSIEGELENMKKGEPKEGGGRGISRGQKEGDLDRARGKGREETLISKGVTWHPLGYERLSD